MFTHACEPTENLKLLEGTFPHVAYHELNGAKISGHPSKGAAGSGASQGGGDGVRVEEG